MASIFGDTAGVQYALKSNGNSSEINEIYVEDFFSGDNCLMTTSGNTGAINGTSFSFTDNQAFYFGQQALYAMGNNPAVNCININLSNFLTNEGSLITISGLDCSSGTHCTGGTVCYRNGQFGWSPGDGYSPC